jgi:hypothetical protein
MLLLFSVETHSGTRRYTNVQGRRVLHSQGAPILHRRFIATLAGATKQMQHLFGQAFAGVFFCGCVAYSLYLSLLSAIPKRAEYQRAQERGFFLRQHLPDR